QILHLALVERRALDVLFGSELLVGQRRGPDVAHPGLNVRAFVARGQVMEIEDAKQIGADLDEHPLSKACGLNRAHGVCGASNEWLKPFDRSIYGRACPWIVASSRRQRADRHATMPNVAFTRWDPLRDLLALHEQIGQLVGSDAPGWTPPVDLYETVSEFVLIAELPGLSRDDVEIHAEDGRIIIRGERSSHVPCEQYHRVERGHGRFSRGFALPEPIAVD